MKWFDLKTTTDYLTPDGVAAGSKLAPQSVTYIVVRGMILAHTFPVSQMSAPAAFNQDVKAVDPGPDIIPRYLAYWLKPTQVTSCGSLGNRRTAQRSLTFRTFASSLWTHRLQPSRPGSWRS